VPLIREFVFLQDSNLLLLRIELKSQTVMKFSNARQRLGPFVGLGYKPRGWDCWTACRNHHHTTCFRITEKSFKVTKRTADPRRIKTAQNSQRRNASNAVLVTWSRAGRGDEVPPWPWSRQFYDGYCSCASVPRPVGNCGHRLSCTLLWKLF
jgi:hypothetical protein